MFCRNCQTIIPDDSVFCENCGAPTGLSPEDALKIDDDNLVPDDVVEFEVVEEAEKPVEPEISPADKAGAESGREPFGWASEAEEPEAEASLEAESAESPEPEAEASPEPSAEEPAFDWNETVSEPIGEPASGEEGQDPAEIEEGRAETKEELSETEEEPAEPAEEPMEGSTEEPVEEESAAEISVEAEPVQDADFDWMEEPPEVVDATPVFRGSFSDLDSEFRRPERTSVPVDPVWWEPPEDQDGVFGFGAAAEQEEPETAFGEDAPADDIHEDRVPHEDAPDWGAVMAEESEQYDSNEYGYDGRPADESSAEGAYEGSAGESEGEEAASESFPKVTLYDDGESADDEDSDGSAGVAGPDDKKADLPGAEGTESGGIDFKHFAEVAAGAAGQVRPYAEKAAEKTKAWLEGLGKSVRTGTGHAADSAKEQFRQMKEDYAEKKEQRDQQREQKKEEDRQRQEELRKLQEEEKQRQEAERQKLEEERRAAEEALKAEEEVIQQPGFWYGTDMPETGTAAEDQENTAEADIQAAAEETAGEQTESSEQVESSSERADQAEADGFVKEPAAEASPWSDLSDAEETAGSEPDDEEPHWDPDPANHWASEVTDRWEKEDKEDTAAAMIGTPVQLADEVRAEQAEALEDQAEQADRAEDQADKNPALEPEMPSSEVIEDKLADTARFEWSAAQLAEALDKEIAERKAREEAGLPLDGAVAADADDALAGAAVRAEEKTAGIGETVAAAAEAAKQASDVEPDEPALYRIKDYTSVREKDRKVLKKRLIIAAVIVLIIAAIAGLAAELVHQAHLRELEEQAYQASVKQAAQLVEKEKYKKAEKLYLELMEQRPEDTSNYVALAQMYIDQERYIDAKALIKRAIKATGDKESFRQMKKDIKVLTSTEWKEEYAKVLQEFESDIKRYEEDVTASTAVCDINGDLKPELFFFTKEYYGYGKLHIYTTVNDEAKEVSYECRNRGTQYQDAFYDVSSDDSSYAIFNCKEEGKLAIYANIVHGNDSWDTTNEYVLNLKGGCKRTSVIEGSIDTTYSEEEQDDSEYLKNEEDISYDQYIDEFKRMLNEADQVILYNGSGGDQAVWDKVKPDSVMCMPFDSMMIDLQAD